MKIQSLSICVPGGCCNRCKFCVAHMVEENYTNQIEGNRRFLDLYKKDFKNRLLFARDNGCNTMILTGNGEPLLNRRFLENIGEWNANIPQPFRWIELQTSGALLDDEYLRFLRNTVGVTTISLSLSSIFSDDENAEYNQPQNPKFRVDIEKLCEEIKRYDFTLRLSLNLTDFYNGKSADEIFARVKALGADQVTMRVLYKSDTNSAEDQWIDEHKADDKIITEIREYIKKNGRALEVLPFGATRYAVNEISTVLDDDCMGTAVTETLKYLILRPDCKLYSHWNDKGSLVF